MTTIVAVQGDGYAVIGSDSRISSMDDDGYTYHMTTLGSGSTKVSANGRYLIGAAGDMRAINILHHAFQPPTPAPTLKAKRLDQFITTKFIPSLRSCFEEQGYAMPERDSSRHIAEQPSTILVVINCVIYVIEGDYAWTSENNGIYAIGTGAAYALGAMHVLMAGGKKTPTSVKQNILKALTTASKYDPHTGQPFQTYTQGLEVPKKQTGRAKRA
jgi:ATP-dependent protease HslVU (ClpYQ) peptidase subunit